MKHPTPLILIICSCAAMMVSAYEFTTSDPLIESDKVAKTPERFAAADDIALQQRMERQAQQISERVGMSSALDASETTDPATGVDMIQELYDCGFIVPATLEEVESALHAAAKTPETEDDTAALILKHRGSYRFFLNQ